MHSPRTHPPACTHFLQYIILDLTPVHHVDAMGLVSPLSRGLFGQPPFLEQHSLLI